jgi:enoyl-CoA hydratase/carnithine racemase
MSVAVDVHGAMPGLRYEKRGHVATMTLDRPERGNSLSRAMAAPVRAVWAEVMRDPEVRVLVVTGSGERHFCTGADVREVAELGRATAGDGLVREQIPWSALAHGVWKPVICALNGLVAGGGLHFVADADIVLAATSATFLDPHVSVGQVSGIEPPSLALRLPLGVITRMAILGAHERIDAQRAFDLGLVSELTEPDALIPRALELAGLVAKNSPAAVTSTRRVLRHMMDVLLEPSMRLGWERVQAHWPHPDAVEGPAAFFEKRPPEWQSRQ